MGFAAYAAAGGSKLQLDDDEEGCRGEEEEPMCVRVLRCGLDYLHLEHVEGLRCVVFTSNI